MSSRAGSASRIALRAASVLARTLGVVALSCLMTVASLLVNLDRPVVRRVVAARVNQLVFAPLFRGTFTIVTLGHVDPFGVSGVHARILDPSGRPVIDAEGVSSRIATLTLLRTLLPGQGDFVLDLEKISIRHADVRIDMDPSGVAIANAFLPREPSTLPSRPDAPGVQLYAPHIHVEHAWVHGLMTGLPYFDGDVSGLDAAFALTPGRVSIEARKGDVLARGIALGHDAEGAFRGHIEVALGSDPRVGGQIEWDGRAGSLRETATVAFEKGRFDGVVDVREASPEAIRSLWPASPIMATGSAHVEAHGPLEAIALSARASADSATVDVEGTVQWGAAKGASVLVDVGGVDLHQFATALPASALGVKGNIAITLSPEGRLDGHADLDFPAGHVGPHAVPHTTLKTAGFRVASGAFGGDATVVIDEPGAPTSVTLHAVPTAQASSVDFSIVSHAVRIGALRRFSTEASGSARVLGKGNVDLEKLKLDVALDTKGDAFQQGLLRIGGLSVQGRARGSLLDPDVDLALRAQSVSWDRIRVSQLDVIVRGRALSPHVTVHEQSHEVPDLDAEADVDLLAGPTFRRVDVRASRAGNAARARADRIRIDHGDIAVDGVLLEGLGAPATASFERVGSSLRLRAHAPKLDAGLVARLLMEDELVHGGDVTLDVDVSVRPGVAEGRAHVTVAHGAIGTLSDVAGHLDGALKERRFVGTAGARVGDIGTVELDAKQLVAGGESVLALSSWRKAWGDVVMEGHVDLARLAPVLPPTALPVSSVQGVLDIKGHFERDGAGDFTPLVELDAGTSGLYVRGAVQTPASTDPGHAVPKPFVAEGVDVTTSIHVNGDTGFLESRTHFHDRAGDLAVLDASSGSIPYQLLYTAPGEALSRLTGVAFDAHLSLPRRSTKTWPALVGRPPLDADVEADAVVHGPLLHPHVVVSAKVASAVVAFTRLTAPLELDLDGQYDGARADLKVVGRERTHSVLAADVHALVEAKDLVTPSVDMPWKASGKLHVDAFPLVTIGPLDDRGVRGRVSGDVQIDDLHAAATGHASFAVASLKVGDAAYNSATATLGADGRILSLVIRLDQDDGFGSITANVPATWGTALLPVPDPTHELTVAMAARRFRVAAVLPFLRGSIDELDGRVDADVQASVDPRTEAIHVQGNAALTDGLFELAAFGGELHDVAGKLNITQQGVLTLEGVTASGVSGQLMAAASARLNGIHLEAASATIQIPKSRALPLSVGGALLGTIDGRFDVTEWLSADHGTIEVKVDVPTLHLLAPEAGSQDVEALGPLPGVTVGRHTGTRGEFVAESVDPEEETDDSSTTRARDARQIHVVTHLGDDVSIRRGTDVRVDLAGGPTVTVTDKTRVTGQLLLRGGSLNLYGKTFEIEQGTVAFVGDDASNPQVSVTAGWSASDGTQIKADFLGPLKTGKVTLRSEPALPRSEIVQLLMFGTIEGQAVSAPPPGTSTTEGIAGNVAAQPLNRALAQFGLSRVSAKVDTSSVSAKPEVEVQIAKGLSVAVAQIIGQPPVGSSPDTTFLTLDWRFLRKWSLAATVGNADSTIVDLLWRYRY